MSNKELDFGQTDIKRLFLSYFAPTILSLTFSALFNIADGIFVGRGVGSAALAAVNIASPVFLLSTGIGLLMGSGLSVVGAMHLGHGDKRAAERCVTLGLGTSLLLSTLLAIVVTAFPHQLCYIFGGSDALLPLVTEYCGSLWFCLFSLSTMLAGLFAIRVDGSPRYAMLSNIIPSMLNIGLDYIMIYEFGMGLRGAALATSISCTVGLIMVAIYFLFISKNMRLTLGAREGRMGVIWHISKSGMPAFLGELAISFMIIVGNYVFIEMLGEEGVAAFSISCYLMPLVFMFGNSIAQSAMPIVSFNYARQSHERVSKTLRLGIIFGVATGLISTVAMYLGGDFLARSFVSTETQAYAYASTGLPIFASGFIFFTLNIVLIGYYQSIDDKKRAAVYMLLRGYILFLAMSLTLPHLLGEPGLWLILPVTELLTFGIIVFTRKRNGTLWYTPKLDNC